MSSSTNKFLELANLPILNTDNTIRYSLMYQIRPESLSDHITEVSMLSYIIATNLNNRGESINIGLVLKKVLLHDVDEVLTGDIPRTTKYYTKESLSSMRYVADEAIKHITDNYINDNGKTLELWRSAKDGKEGFIVDLSDMLCVARKVVREYAILGNTYFLKVAYEMDSNLDNTISKFLKDKKDDFTKESVKYISDLLIDAKALMEEYIEDSKFKKYGIDHNVFKTSKL